MTSPFRRFNRLNFFHIKLYVVFNLFDLIKYLEMIAHDFKLNVFIVKCGGGGIGNSFQI
jgi:hypothetical protein